MQSKHQYLQEIGVNVWRDKNKDILAQVTTNVEINDLRQIRTLVENCTKCSLSKTRTHAVFGVGDEKAQIMFIGEAPGANEDLQGEPFVGRAGMLLNTMLQAIGLERRDVYIANILKCRPPNNRDPQPEEVKLCTPYLQQQIALIQPKVLVAVGRIAAQFLLNTTDPMSRLRGNIHAYGPERKPLIVTYHPAYLLRSPGEKRKAYGDFLLLQRTLKSELG